MLFLILNPGNAFNIDGLIRIKNEQFTQNWNQIQIELQRHKSTERYLSRVAMRLFEIFINANHSSRFIDVTEGPRSASKSETVFKFCSEKKKHNHLFADGLTLTFTEFS